MPNQQPLPQPGCEDVIPRVISDILAMHDAAGYPPQVLQRVVSDIQARLEEGIKTYGRPLQTHNGRSCKRDLLEELFDAANYAKQDCMENVTGANQQRYWVILRTALGLAEEMYAK